MSDVIKFTIPGKPEYFQMVKMAVGAAACTADFSAEAIDDIKIAVGEGCKNICCHGFDGWSGCMEITCDIEEEKLTVNITDAVCDHRITKTKRPCMDCPKEGDLAVHIIKSIMDEVEIVKASQGNKSIKMVKNKC